MDKRPFVYVLLSAILFGISPPLAKLLVADMPSVTLAGMLYLGAFFGLTVLIAFGRLTSKAAPTTPLDRKDLPWLAGAIAAGGVFAPIALMTGLTMMSGFATSLLLNLEGVATAVIAVVVFREYAGKRLWIALLLMTLAGIFLSWDPAQGELDLLGPLLVVAAMVGWGVDNNLTQRISGKDPRRIAQLKGLIAGSASLGLAFLLGLEIPLDAAVIYALVLGSLSYGLSLVLFIRALDGLGSSRTGTFFSVGPFAGALASVLVLGEVVTWPFALATLLMALGVYIVVTERHAHLHRHERVVHSHSHEADVHHAHAHPEEQPGPHSHEHEHDAIVHSHGHWPDQHHRHDHR